MQKKLILIPKLQNPIPEKNTTEWQLPEQAYVALTFIEKYGYTLMAKVKVKKKHFWNRPWKVFAAHSPAEDEAVKKGLGFLEKYGYKINHRSVQSEDIPDNQEY